MGIVLIHPLRFANPDLCTAAFTEEIDAVFRQSVELKYAQAEVAMARNAMNLHASIFQRLSALYRQFAHPRNWS
ncbi:MAG TPA: hypothetical protein VIG85_09920 [Comamonas sp.]